MRGAVDEIPPRDVFEFRQPPLGATCGHNQQPADEEGSFLQRHTQGREQLHQEGPEIREGRGAARQPGDLGLSGACQQHARGHCEIVERVAVRAIRNAPHGVGDVLVEAGEEAETVLAGKRQPAAAVPNREPECCAPCRRAPACAHTRAPESRAPPVPGPR